MSDESGSDRASSISSIEPGSPTRSPSGSLSSSPSSSSVASTPEGKGRGKKRVPSGGGPSPLPRNPSLVGQHGGQRRTSGGQNRGVSPLTRKGTGLGVVGSGSFSAPNSPPQHGKPGGGGVPLFHNVKEVRCEGWLHKKNSSGMAGLRGWQKRYFILFPHSLCYWPNEKAAQSNPPKGKWECSKIVRVIQDEAKSDKRFDIVTADDRTIELKAETAEDATFWIENLPGDKQAGAPKQSLEMLLAQSQPPPEEELNTKFEAFMEEKCFKPEARERMRLLPAKNKWMLICQDQAQASSKGAGEGVEKYLRTLRAPKINVKDVESLKVAISGSGKSWMNEFVKIGGLSALLALLSKDTSSGGLAAHALDCLKSFMNNEFGLNAILTTSDAVDQIALVLTFADDNMCMQVIDLLLVTCWISEEGHRSVINALENSRFGRRFQVLTDFLKRGSDVVFKSKVMTFINTIINARDILEERVATRQEFLDLGLAAHLEDLRIIIEKNRGQAGYEKFEQLRVQIDLFEEEMAGDRRETRHNELDLADMDAVLAFLKENTIATGFSVHMLTALHRLLLIPAEKFLGKKVWDNVNHILEYATHSMEDEDAEDEEDAYTVLTFDRLKVLLKEKEKQSIIDEKNQLHEMEKEAEALRRELHEVQMKEQRYLDKISQLEMKLASALSNPGSISADTPVPPTDAPPMDAPPMDAPPMDAPPMDAPPMDAPPFDGPPMDGPDAPPFDAPPMDGPPMGGATSAKLNLKPKKKVKPALKLKAFHWRTIEPKNVNETIWKELNDEDIKFDTHDFENVFVKAAEVKKKGKKKGDGEEDEVVEEVEVVKPKKEVISLLEAKRSYNINISLARFRMTHSRIRDAVLEMDEKILDEERLGTLLKCAPTNEELESVAAYDGEESLLGEAEKFFRVMKDIPRLPTRLELFLFKQRYESTIYDVVSNLQLCETSIHALKNSASLRKVLEVILAFGNYLNGGTNKGGAYGFRLDTIIKIKNTKGTTESGINLLHYLVQTVDREFKDARKFIDDLRDIHGAARVELSFLASEVNKVSANVRKLERELKAAKTSTKDRFETVMAPFHRVANEKAEELTTRLKGVEDNANKLAYMFGEDPKSMPMGEMFTTFSTFVTDYRKAEIYLQKKAEAEEKNRKRKVAEEMRKQAAASRKSQTLTREASGSIQLDAQSMPVTTSEEKKNEPIVDKVVGALQGDAGSIRQLIRARRRKAGAGRARRGSNLVDSVESLGQSNRSHKSTLADLAEESPSSTPSTPVRNLRATSSGSSSPTPSSPSLSGSGHGQKVAPTSINSSAPKTTKRKKKPLWQAIADPDSGDTYYYNLKTGESVWDKPQNFPY